MIRTLSNDYALHKQSAKNTTGQPAGCGISIFSIVLG